MCKLIIIATSWNDEDLIEKCGSYSSQNDNLISMGSRHFGRPKTVELDQINGHCLCQLTNEEKIELFDVIEEISI